MDRRRPPAPGSTNAGIPRPSSAPRRRHGLDFAWVTKGPQEHRKEMVKQSSVPNLVHDRGFATGGQGDGHSRSKRAAQVQAAYDPRAGMRRSAISHHGTFYFQNFDRFKFDSKNSCPYFPFSTAAFWAHSGANSWELTLRAPFVEWPWLWRNQCMWSLLQFQAICQRPSVGRLSRPRPCQTLEAWGIRTLGVEIDLNIRGRQTESVFLDDRILITSSVKQVLRGFWLWKQSSRRLGFVENESEIVVLVQNGHQRHAFIRARFQEHQVQSQIRILGVDLLAATCVDQGSEWLQGLPEDCLCPSDGLKRSQRVAGRSLGGFALIRFVGGMLPRVT
eukprot:symbB.v1.2.032797.t1/scaffold3986.1/size50362/5